MTSEGFEPLTELNEMISQIGNLSFPDRELWMFGISGIDDENWIRSESRTI
jgi:hypothetical protein